MIRRNRSASPARPAAAVSLLGAALAATLFAGSAASAEPNFPITTQQRGTAKQVAQTGVPLSELASCMTKFPQILVNVPVREKRSFDTIPGVSARLAALEAELADTGRILLRYSGTESLARIMVEGEEQGRVEKIAGELAGMIRAAIGR